MNFVLGCRYSGGDMVEFIWEYVYRIVYILWRNRNKLINWMWFGIYYLDVGFLIYFYGKYFLF